MRIITINTLLLIISFLFAGISPAYAKSETFDIFTYKAPAGYEKDTSKNGMVTYTKIKGNKFCMIGIYMSRQSSGNSQQDFDNEWNELVAKPFNIGDGNVIKEDKDSGWDIILKADKAQTEGTGEFYVTLTSFSGHGRVSSVIINYNDESVFQKDIDNFFNNFDTVKDFNKKQPLASNNSANAIPVSGGGSPNIKGGKITGVWMGYENGGYNYSMVSDTLRYSITKPEMAWRVFFSDGTYSQGIPFSGLYNLNIIQSQQDERDNKPTGARWGRYTISGNTITAHHNTIINDRVMTIINDNQIKDHLATFYKAINVDGLKLDGMWGWTPTLDKPESEDSFAHVIKFSKDGRFTDYGIFAISQDHFTEEDAPGSGTYQIKDYTLILSYSDSRVTYRSFTVPFNPKSVADIKIIYIRGQDRYKLD